METSSNTGAPGGRSAPRRRAPPGLEVLVLGTAQDGGVPHPGCTCPNCSAARAGAPGVRRTAASLAVMAADGDGHSSFVLVDAGPDLRRQWELFLTGDLELAGIMITHLHMGHVAGLLELGPEVLATQGVPVWCTSKVARFLSDNAPWSLLIRRGHVDLRVFQPGEVIRPLAGLAAVGIAVSHRDEFGDTVGYALTAEDTGRTLLYIPDADTWAGMRPGLRDLVATADGALLDGTFFDHGELAARRGQEAARVPHPPVHETLGLLGELVGKAVFTHLNHTNPLLDEGSWQAAEVREAGARVARDGMVFRL